MLTKRQLLQYVGSVAGAAGVYRTMAALGMLGVSSLTGCSSPASSQGPGDGKKVVILGAGIAGLTAAYELSKVGYDCTILEATARVGGRNLTVRSGDMIEEFNNTQQVDFDDEDYLYANMGPARIPYHHETILKYCKQFGVELEVFTNDNRAAFFQGKNTTFDGVTGKPVPGRRLLSDQRGYISELLAKAVNRGALDMELTDDDKEKLLSMLQSFGALDNNHMYSGSGRSGYHGPHVNKGLGLGGDADKVQSLTLREVLGLNLDNWENYYVTWFTHGLNQNPTLFQPVGGMDHIGDAFRREATARGALIMYETVVEEIENMADGTVTIRYSEERSGNRSFETADHVICTIPAPVLAGITNNFSDETQTAIADTPFSKAVKIAFQAPRRFWENDDQIYGGISWTSFDELTQIWYPANGYHRQKGVILGAYIFGEPGFGLDAAERFAAMTPTQRLDKALMYGEQIHPGYREQLTENGRINGVSRAWSEVRYQMGGWSYAFLDAPGISTLRQDNGVLKDGNVHFAGDQASELPGWQEGAALSALEAVRAIRAGG